MKQFNEYVSVGPSAGNVQPVADLGDIPPFNQALFAQKGKQITKSDLDQVERYADKLFAACVYSNSPIRNTVRKLQK